MNTIENIRKTINSNYPFISTSKMHLKVLKDFLWVISGKEWEKSVTLPEGSACLKYIPYIHYLDEKLKKVSSYQEKLKIYNKKAIYYEELDKIYQLNSLCH